jgi:transcription initiation factor TFIIIB Brf1 subunit/transcription initiation factor TFIIB
MHIVSFKSKEDSPANGYRLKTQRVSRRNKSEGITPKWLKVDRVNSYCRKIWRNNPSVAKKNAFEMLLILNQAYEKKPCFFSGKTEKGILSGLLYYLSQKNNSVKTQLLIARSLETTEVTVRESYRNWIQQFPHLIEAKL